MGSSVEKVLIIGWDGATWEYIDPLLEDGRMPHLQRLVERGSRAILDSTRPPYTHVAWPSLVTGMGPSKTGIFDGGRLVDGGYDFIPAPLIRHRGIPIWSWVNRYGKRAGVLNVPTTFPATPLDGYMVTGFDSPKDSDEIAFPQDQLLRWTAEGRTYRVLEEETDLMDHQNPHQDREPIDEFARRWSNLTREQGQIVRWLWQEDPVDLMFVVFSGTDSINHRTHSSDHIGQVYQAADEALGKILDICDDQTLICLVSDHGSLPAKRYISLYRALHDAGWLHFQPRVARRFLERLPGFWGNHLPRLWERMPAWLQRVLSWLPLHVDGRLVSAYGNIDWTQTQVFARTGLGALYLNVRERQPEGTIHLQEYDAFVETVRSYFLSLRDDRGYLLFRHAWRPEEIYGSLIPQDTPPDLLLEPRRWSDHMITGYPNDPLVRSIPRERPYGTHRPDGIFLLSGFGIKRGFDLGSARIVDVMPTVLAAWGCPIPNVVDGQVLIPAFLRGPEVRRVAVGELEETPPDVEGDAQELVARLRALGYMQ